MEHDHQSVGHTLLEAAALHVDPDDPEKGRRLIAAHVETLVWRVRAVKIGINVALAVPALSVFLLAWREGLSIPIVAAILIIWIALSRDLLWHLIADPNSPLHDRFGFLWPKEPPELRAFFDKLASGELSAYYRD